MANLKREVNPLIRVRPIRGNPKPVNVNQTVFVSRTIQVVKTAASNTANLSISDVRGSVAAASDIRIDFIKCWNAVPGSSLQAKLASNKVVDSTQMHTDIIGEDFGTFSSLSGVKFDIPLTLALDITDGVGTDNVVVCTTGSATDKVIFQVGIRMSI